MPSNTREQTAQAAGTSGQNPEQQGDAAVQTSSSVQEESAGDGPVIIPAGKPAKAEAEAGSEADDDRVEVFRYGDRVFTMPRNVTAKQALRAIWAARKHGPMIAGLEAVEALCGPEALEVLLTAPEVTDFHLLDVVDRVTSHLLAIARETATGKESTGA